MSLPVQRTKNVLIHKISATETGYITMDPGFGNTGSCYSSITYVDGAKGILRYRGYPIEELAEKAIFIETAYLVLYGELPNKEQLKTFSDRIKEHAPLHTNLEQHFSGFPKVGTTHGNSFCHAQPDLLFSSGGPASADHRGGI